MRTSVFVSFELKDDLSIVEIGDGRVAIAAGTYLPVILESPAIASDLRDALNEYLEAFAAKPSLVSVG